MSDIGGDWDGVYSYGGRQRDFPAMPFGAAFAPADAAGGFAGIITDAGGLGAADVAGAVNGAVVVFVKTYQQSRPGVTAPIYYTGTLSPDGWMVQGTWEIYRRPLGLFLRQSTGLWQMQRPGLPPMLAVWPPPPRATER